LENKLSLFQFEHSAKGDSIDFIAPVLVLQVGVKMTVI